MSNSVDSTGAGVKIGRNAVVVGGGIAGLLVATTLCEFFERVVVVERDALPDGPEHRAGVPHARHVHALLSSGENVMASMFPGFVEELHERGVPTISGLDILNRGPLGELPRRDLGLRSQCISRPMLEHCIRSRVRAFDDVEIQQGRVTGLEMSQDGKSVSGVRVRDGAGATRVLPAELTIDASGRGGATLEFLEEIGQASPEETRITINLGYASRVYEAPTYERDWIGAQLMNMEVQRGGLLLPMEGGRYMLSAGGGPDNYPPTDPEGFVDFLQPLTEFHYFALNARPLSAVASFRFPYSIHRHFERLDSFVDGILPIGDAICSFNPVHGQGMSVAALEVDRLRSLLLERSAGCTSPLRNLASPYFESMAEIVAGPWQLSAFSDLNNPANEALRPPDFAERMAYFIGLVQLMIRDPEFHKLFTEVFQLVRPVTDLYTPEIRAKVAACTDAAAQ